MSKDFVVALDQGTTSSRAILFDRDLTVRGMAQRELTQHYPQSGWVEQDPMEIYATQSAVLTQLLAQSGIGADRLAAVGITNQRETTILWEKESGRPVCPAIVWQCRRSAPLCEELAAKGLGGEIAQRTGLTLDPYFSGTKIRWALDNVPGLRQRAERGEILFGTVDCWLLYKLTSGRIHVTDHTNASRTLLYNIETHDWDDTLLEVLDIPRALLPQIRDSSEVYAEASIDGVAVPLAGAAGDQQAALFGQGCFGPGEAKNTYGTGCFLLMNTGETLPRSQNGLITTVAVGLGGRVQYALEGSIFVGGALIQWLRDELGFVERAVDSEALAGSVADSGGVYIVPAFTGLGAPHWDMHARGAIYGLSRGTGRAHLARAALEAIAHQVCDVAGAMARDTGLALRRLQADGGASQNNLLMQIQSDLLGVEVHRPAVIETTALGAAALAGLAVGIWKDQNELKRLLRADAVFSPAMADDCRQHLRAGWADAVRRTLGGIGKA